MDAIVTQMIILFILVIIGYYLSKNCLLYTSDAADEL